MAGDEGAPTGERLPVVALAVLIGVALVVVTLAADGWAWLTQALTIP